MRFFSVMSSFTATWWVMRPSGWRIGEHAGWAVRLGCGERTDHVRIVGTPQQALVFVEDSHGRTVTASCTGGRLSMTLDGVHCDFLAADADRQIWLAGERGTVMLTEVREASVRPDDDHSGDAELLSPMPGSVIAVGAADGDRVTAGTVIVAGEAMKMEHSLRAPVDGVVALLVGVGEQVKVGQPLARIITAEEGADT